MSHTHQKGRSTRGSNEPPKLNWPPKAANPTLPESSHATTFLPTRPPAPSPELHNAHVLDTSAPINAKIQVLKQWHLRLGHAHPRKIQTMAKHHMLPSLPSSLGNDAISLTCSACLTDKLRPAPNRRTHHTNIKGEQISSDLLGPITPPSRIHNQKYAVTFVDTVAIPLHSAFEKPERSLRCNTEAHRSNLQSCWTPHAIIPMR